MAALEFYRT